MTSDKNDDYIVYQNTGLTIHIEISQKDHFFSFVDLYYPNNQINRNKSRSR
jgi:hypothetical protein